jgi:hypothetical protein
LIQSGVWGKTPSSNQIHLYFSHRKIYNKMFEPYNALLVFFNGMLF